MDAEGPSKQPPVGLPEPEEPDDSPWIPPDAEDVLLDERPLTPVAPPAPPVPAPPVRIVPPADRLRDSSVADWIGGDAPASQPAPAPMSTPARGPLGEPTGGVAAGRSALEAVVGSTLPPLPAASRKTPPPLRKPGAYLDIAARYEARLRLSGLTGDAFVAARVATDPPATLKAAVVRFGRGADPLLSPIPPIADPDSPATREREQ